MLPGDAQLQKLTKVIGPLQFDLQLPLSPDEFFVVSGPRRRGDDNRRFGRQRLRGVAALQHGTSLPALSRPVQWHKVILCDISRSGVRFLHSEQILPTEQMLLVMPDFKRRYVEIVRCHRLGDRYFEIGARFVKCLRPLPSSEKPAGSDAPGDTEPAGA
jgi:hypothetical protein